jgi:peptide/nickel transport system substrate-binding protein
MLFHDGSKVTTEDVKYSWVTRPQKDKRLAVAGLLQDLKDVEILSPTQAVLVYSKPSPSAEFYLGFLTVYIIPKDITRRSAMKASLPSRSARGPTSSSIISEARESRSKPSTSIGPARPRSRA